MSDEAVSPSAELTGRSLTNREYLDALFAWLDLRLDALEGGQPVSRARERDPEADLARAIANAEGRRMIERLGEGESWEAIRESTRSGFGPGPS